MASRTPPLIAGNAIATAAASHSSGIKTPGFAPRGSFSAARPEVELRSDLASSSPLRGDNKKGRRRKRTGQDWPRPLLNARELRYRDFITVALMINKPEIFADNWIYIHDPSVKVGRVQNFGSWSPEMAPAGTTCLGLEYFCFEGDGLWTMSDEELIALATREITKVGLASPADVSDGCVVRQPKAYPVYDDAYRDHMEMIRLDLEQSYPCLHRIGRNGMHKYNNQDHAMMTGMTTARNILAGERIYDIWQVNEDAEYHEAGASSAQVALASERLVPLRASKRAA